MKICKLCGYEGENFEKNRHTCKKCRALYKRNRVRTKIGHIQKVYFNQRRASKMRGHAMPEYTFKELCDWVMSKPQYHVLHKKWVSKNYDKLYAPSLDRIDNNFGYKFTNIQLVTWAENNIFAHEDCKVGKLSTGNKNIRVSKFTLDGLFIENFPTVRAAARNMGTSCHKEIIKCCKGIYKTCKGFKWKYAIDIDQMKFNHSLMKAKGWREL